MRIQRFESLSLTNGLAAIRQRVHAWNALTWVWISILVMVLLLVAAFLSRSWIRGSVYPPIARVVASRSIGAALLQGIADVRVSGQNVQSSVEGVTCEPAKGVDRHLAADCRAFADLGLASTDESGGSFTEMSERLESLGWTTYDIQWNDSGRLDQTHIGGYKDFGSTRCQLSYALEVFPESTSEADRLRVLMCSRDVSVF